MLDYKDANTKKIGDVAEVFSGFAFKAEELLSVGIPVLKIANIQDKKVTKSTVSFFPETRFKQKLSRYKYQLNDVLVAMTGEGSVGKFGKMIGVDRIYLVNQRVGVLRPDLDKIDPEYFYQVLTLPQYEEALYQLGLGAGQPNVSPKDIGRLYIPFPPLPTQKRISSILNAYDELIEVNNQRIKLLEETARELYKEWFVRMRFPGYKQAKFVKGVPEGWEVKKVKEIVNRKRFGRTYRPEELMSQGKVIVIDQSTDELLGYHDNEPDHFASSLNPMIIFGDHSCKMQLIIEPFSLAENVIPVSSKDQIPIFFLFYLIESLVETTEYKRHWNDLVTKSVFVCPPDLQKKYAEIVKPFFEQIDVLKKQNIHLRQIRDRLLPRLISGKLEVKAEKVLLNSETETKYN